jgi:glyoxylase-like metal-dependent hydrolase (beta-lactamase superfamily II)
MIAAPTDVRELAAGLWMLPGVVNWYLVADERGVLILDAGLPHDWDPPVLYMRNASARAAANAMRRGGAFRPTRIRAWTPVADGETLGALPGAPVAVATPGHTPGHTAYLLPAQRAVVAGDALVTFDPYTGVAGPRLIARGATWDSGAAGASLDRLAELDADLVLTGHGAPFEGPVAAAARAARDAVHP